MHHFPPEDEHLPRFTTPALVRAHDRAAARLAALAPVLTPLARRWPELPAPADLLDLVREALRPVGPVASALAGEQPLPIHGPVSVAALAARCRLAEAQLARYRARYHRWLPLVEAEHWAVRPWITVSLAEAEAEADPEDAPPEPDPGYTPHTHF